MEVNEENLNRMVECLKQTLSPDPNLRRPGKSCGCVAFKHNLFFVFIGTISSLLLASLKWLNVVCLW